MDTCTIERVALMSIHPVYASAIIDGTKTIEFRKRRLASDISTVLVYATSPTKMIVGSFVIDLTVEASPEEMWRDYGQRGAISKRSFFSYYRGYHTAVGFSIGAVRALSRPVRLEQVSRHLVPPQSFLYLPSALADDAMADVRPTLSVESPIVSQYR